MDLQFHVKFIQGSLFFPNFPYGAKLNLVNALNKSTPILLEKDPTFLPIPDDAPPEIPRIILSNKTGEFQCNISPNRIDFFYHERKEPKLFDEIFQKVYPLYRDLFFAIKSDFNPSINRISLVTKLMSALSESSINLIMKLFLKERMFGNPYNLDLIILYKEMLDTFKINRLTKIRSLRKKDNLEDDTRLELDIEINTLSEILGNYSVEAIDKFYQLIKNNFNQYVAQFFEQVH